MLVDGTTVTGTDLDNHTIVPFAGNGEGKFTLPVKQAENILKGETGPLTIKFVPITEGSTSGSGWAHLEFGGCTFKLPTMSIQNWPQTPVVAATALKTDGKSFKQAIERTRFAISDEESRYTLNGALLSCKDGLLRLIATDGHRMAIVRYPHKGNFECIIPCDTLDWLNVNLGETVEFGRGVGKQDKTLTIKTDGKTILARETNGQFPSYEAVRRAKYNHTATIADPKKVHSLLARVAKCSDERSGCVRFRFDADLTISAESTESGSSRADIPYTVEPALERPFIFGVNNSFILDFLKRIGDSDFTVGLHDPQSAFSFNLGDSYEYIVMPMRI